MPLHLIGVLHYDLKGDERLRKALRVEKPDILTLEMTDVAPEQIKDNEIDSQLEMLIKTLKEKFDSKTLSFFENYVNSISPFEKKVCQEYSKEFNIPLIYVDDPETVPSVLREIKKWVKEFFEKVEPDFFSGTSIERIQSGYDTLYEYFQKLYDGEIPQEEGEKLIDYGRGKMIGKRDEYQARKIARIVSENPEKKIVHVGGCVHLLSDSKGETLYSKLEKFNPTRATIWKYKK